MMMDFTDWDNYFVANPKDLLSSRTPQATTGQKTVITDSYSFRAFQEKTVTIQSSK